MTLSHRERLENTLSQEKTDRIPIALWHHFPVDDQDPIALANATIAFQASFDFDLVKVMPTSSFCIKDWGVDDKWEGDVEGTRRYTKRAINHVSDWAKLIVLDPYKGFLDNQLKCLARLKEAFSDHTPYIQTIFNPLSQAKNLIGEKLLLSHLRQYPEALHTGLEIITETTIKFIEAAKQFGIDGIFLALQHASYHLLSEREYQEFGKPYDLKILKAVDDLWLNMAHIHGTEIMFDLVSDYPVQILNWHDRETAPDLKTALDRFPGVVCGGIGRIDTLVLGTPAAVTKQAHQAIEQTNGTRLILSTGCVLPLNTPYGNILAARQSVEGKP